MNYDLDLARAANRFRRERDAARAARAELVTIVRELHSYGWSIRKLAESAHLATIEVRRMLRPDVLERPATSWSEHPLPGHPAPIIRRYLDQPSAGDDGEP